MILKLSNELPAIEDVLEQWKTIRSEVLKTLEQVPEHFFTYKPEGNPWSISLLMEHIYLSQLNSVRPFPAVLSGKFGSDCPKDYTQKYSSIFEALQKPSGVKNPENVAPKNQYSREEIKELLKKAEDKMLSVCKNKTRTELEKRGYEHPIFGFLHLFDWLWLMGLHEYSHLIGLQKRLESQA
ncbi:MAG: DinB family protein [Leptospiraceae bacterium]|nr:DinB family protein [Leptospiraceae bacterium]MCP5498558.1 DinB family protein [Leptospiraceae bacterium]